MARRATPKRLPALRFQVDGRYVLADVVELSGTTAFIRSAEKPLAGRPVVFEWAGAARHTLVATVRHVSEAAPDGRYGIALDLLEITSQEGAEAPAELARRRFGLVDLAPVRSAGAVWSLRVAGGPVAAAPVRAAPAMRLAGGATAAIAPPLITGLAATTPERVGTLLESLGAKIGLYINAQCAYWVAGAQYWGKATRVSDRWLQVTTNNVVPGLGVKIRCDLTIDLDGEKRPVAVHGIVGRKQDGPTNGPYKALLWVAMHSLDEGASPGLFAVWLERVFRERRDGEPDEP